MTFPNAGPGDSLEPPAAASSDNDTLKIAQMNVSLRPLEDRDLDAIYQQVTDPESVRMAAFTAEDQTDRAFLNRMSRLRADTSVSHRVRMPNVHCTPSGLGQRRFASSTGESWVPTRWRQPRLRTRSR